MQSFVHALGTRRLPVLVQEGPGPERLELTGPVLANWIFKSVGLLGELEVGPVDAGGRALGIVGAENLHWRALAALLAAWALGAEVHVLGADDAEPEDEWIAFLPEAPEEGAELPGVTASAAEVLVSALPGLALSARAPQGCLDYLSTVRTHPDVAAVAAHRSGRVHVAGSALVVAIPSVGGAPGAGHTAHTPSGVPGDVAAWEALLGALLTGELVLRTP